MGSIVRIKNTYLKNMTNVPKTEDDYSELDNFNGYEQNYFRYHYVPTDNNFVVSVQVSGGVPDFKIDNRMGHNTKGRQFAGYKNWEFFKEGHTYRFHQHNNSNKYYPLGFSYMRWYSQYNNTGKSLGEDQQGPYYVKGTASNGDNGFFLMYKMKSLNVKIQKKRWLVLVERLLSIKVMYWLGNETVITKRYLFFGIN